MPYKIAHGSKLSPPTLYASPEEAVAAGKDAFPGEDFKVQEVRPARLSDFYSPTKLVGDIREGMAELCGDDSVLDAVKEDGQPMFDHSQFNLSIQEALDNFAEDMGLDLSAINIVVRTHDVRAE